MIKLFCERLRKLRLDSDYSQARLAMALGMPQQTIDKWERGLNVPSAETLIQLAAFFDVSADYLLGLSNEFGSGRKTKDQLDEEIMDGTARTHNNATKKKTEPVILPQPTMHYIHVPMRGGNDKEVFVTDEKYKEMEKNLREAGNKHYQDEKNKKNPPL